MSVPGAPVQLGNYRLLRELGRGGQGVVWLAEDLALGRRVAVKLLKPGACDSAEALHRFLREAELASRLDHPGICAVYGSGIEGRRPWFAMRHVEGESLAQRLAAGVAPPAGRSEVLETVRLVEETARALHAAHEAGVLHRDVKPGNILLDQDRRPVIADFGLAREESGEGAGTLSGDRLGTPAYRSPEQIASGLAAVDRRSDIYALGVTLYEALTLRRPFEAPTAPELERAIVRGDAPRARQWNRALPRDLDVVVTTAIDRDPARRYRTAQDFAEDLRRVREREPIRARPAGPWLRARRWVERSPVAAAALASVVLALATGLTTTLVLLGRARAESNARERALIAVGEARTRADAGFAGATEAIDEMLTEVAMGTLTEVPGAATERRRLLEDARDLSLEFLRTLGDDPRLEARVGQAYLNLGTLRTKLNEESAAVLELERGLWLVSGLAERDPTARPLLAQLHCQYASCLAELGRGPEAIAHQELGLALCEERLARAPRERARILALAHAELLGGAVNQRLDRDPEAERCWHRALRRLDLLAASGPLSVQQRMLGVTARRSLGDVIGEQRGPEAELLLCQAIGELEALRGKVAERSSHQALLAECWLKYGRRREDEVDDVGADAAYRIALHHLAAPEARASELPTPRYLRACCLRQRAQLLYRMGAIAQAEAAYEAALDQEPELLADAGQNAARLGEVRSIRYERAAIRAERGRWDSRTEIDIRSRLALQEHLLTLSPNDPEALAACGEAHSLLGRFLPDRPEAEEHLRKAEEVLDRAVECAADPGMVRLMRAGFHLRAGRHWAAQGQKGRAARSLRLARKECESMTRTRPGDVRWARVHVSTLEFLVPLVADPAEQEQVYVALVNLRRAFLASGDPGLDAPRYWSAMGRLWGMRWKNGNDEARDRLLECVCALRGLIEADPRDPPNRAELARTLYYLSQGHAVREQWKEARSTIDESLELLRALHREVPKEPLSRRLIRLAHFHRISILRATDGGDEARAEAARLLALDRSDVEDACTAAEALALCAVEEAADSGEREGYASKAVAALEEAVRRGLRDPARLRDDRSFRVLGGREDFERLLRRLGPGAR